MGYIRDRWKDPARKGRGHRWQVKYQVDGREKDGGSFEVREVAKRKLVELESAVQRGQWVDPTDRTTVSDYARRWAAGRPHGPRTAARVDSLIRNHIDATDLGGRRLSAVLPSEAQGWATGRAQILAPATLRKLVGLVRSVYAAAVLDRLVSSSPVARLVLPPVSTERFVPLTVDQVTALADAMAPRFRPMVYAQAGLGLRIGELLALRVQDVEFLGRAVRVEHQVEPKTLRLIAPKTPRSRRTVPLAAPIADVLASHLRVHPSGPGGLLWYTRTGRPISHDYYGSRVFTPAVAAAGLPAGTSSHDLRHHFATELLDAGLSVFEVAELLGHENATLVVKTYGHRKTGGEDRVRKIIGAAWNGRDFQGHESETAQGRPG